MQQFPVVYPTFSRKLDFLPIVQSTWMLPLDEQMTLAQAFTADIMVVLTPSLVRYRIREPFLDQPPRRKRRQGHALHCCRGPRTLTRVHLADPSVTRWYHCITRCIRLALLLAEGTINRKRWIDGIWEVLPRPFPAEFADLGSACAGGD